MSSPVEKGGTGERSSERARKSPCKSAKGVSSPRKSAKSVSSPRKSAKSVSSPRSDQSGTTHQAEVPTKIEKSSVVKTDGEESDSSPQIKRSKLQEGAGSDLGPTVPTASAKRRAEVPTKVETSSVVKTDGEGADSSLQIKRSKLEDDAGSDLGSTVPTASAKGSESTVLEAKETDGSSSKPLESEIAFQSDEPPPGKSVEPEEDGSNEASTGSIENRAELDVVFRVPDVPPPRETNRVEERRPEAVAPTDESDSREADARVEPFSPGTQRVFLEGLAARVIATHQSRLLSEMARRAQQDAASRGGAHSRSARTRSAQTSGMDEAEASELRKSIEHLARKKKRKDKDKSMTGLTLVNEKETLIVAVFGANSGICVDPTVGFTDGQYIIHFDVSPYDDESINVHLARSGLEVYAKQVTSNDYGAEMHVLHQIFELPIDLIDVTRLTATITSDSRLFIQAPFWNRRLLDPPDAASQKTAEE